MTGTTETPIIALREVTRTYPGPPAVAALRPCGLSIGRGEYVTVIGPSGSGKSTLLNIIGLLDRPDRGTYELDGLDTAELSEGQRTAVRGRRIGFVFQSYHLLPQRTALENVMAAMLYNGVPRRERGPRAAAALADVGLTRRAGGLATALSGGEKQRVAIARALVNRPRLLLCDEPTGNLDTRTGDGVLALIDDLSAAGITVCVITHDPRVAARGHRTVQITDGVLREQAR